MSYLKLAAAASIAGLLTFTHLYAYNAGKDKILSRLQSDRIEVLKDGKAIDEEVLGADDNLLCDLLGGCLQPEP